MPVPPDSATPAVDQFQLLEAYVAMNVENWQFSRQKPIVGTERMDHYVSGNLLSCDMFRVDVLPF